ncbi:MAG TPA: class I SAM-dependent methyltransferase [Kiloniellaceae bacterium]|nr:class I SAM-dependent methyltransferase [Kiloniellaceae bacterium]
MSRLDSFIRRMEAQRLCLAFAAAAIADVPGAIFELGLGNGRTYDHLREICPDREIFVFERKVAAHPDCIPDDAHLFEGMIDETLPEAAKRLAGQVALLHSDICSGDPLVDARNTRLIAAEIKLAMRSGGIVLSDQAIASDGLEEVPPPDGVSNDRYFLYRVL